MGKMLPRSSTSNSQLASFQRCVLVLAICLVLPASLFGQRGSITGRVTDAAGAVVPNAKVTATGASTGVSTGTSTNEQGYYSIPFLISGEYSVKVEVQGFQTAVESGIKLETEQVARVDVSLRVGSVSERMEVTASTSVLDTETSGSSQTMDSKTISEMPVPGGGVYSMMLMTGEAMNTAVTAMIDPTSPRLGSAISVAGTRSTNTEFSVDGMVTMSRTLSAKMVPMEAVREFRMDVTTADASMGHSAGGFVNTTLKSGTNQFHGAMWEFNHSAFMRAMDFFSKRFLNDPRTGPVNDAKRAIATPTNNINRNGFQLGGPIYIPKVYDGRNRSFFMFTWEKVHWRKSGGANYTVPTAAERSGDFSALLPLGSVYQIYDPNTVTAVANGRFSRLPLAGNIVPANRIDPIAAKLMQYWPMPNAVGTADGINNYFSGQPFQTHSDDIVIRLDHSINDRNKLSLSTTVWNQPDYGTNNFPNAENQQTTTDLIRYGVVEYVRILSPSLVMSIRGGFTYWSRLATPTSQGFDITSLGFPSTLQRILGPEGRFFPNVSVNGYTALGVSGKNGYADSTPVLAVNLTKAMGRHSLRFGADLRVLREAALSSQYAAGQYVFNSDWTRGPLDNAAAAPIGQGLASMLLGRPTGGQALRSPSYAEQSTYYGFYFQDDFKLTSKLTLNLGLRYEYEGAPTERFNRSVRGFIGDQPNPIQAQAQASYAKAQIAQVPAANFVTPGGVSFAGVGGLPHELWQPDRNNFAPRIGLAWSFAPLTVFRASYAILYDTLGINHQNVIQTGFEQPTNLVASLDNGQTFQATLANPFPNGILDAPGASLGMKTYLGRAVTFYDTHPLNPYMQRWMADIQREVRRGILLDISYVGNRGTKLLISRQVDPVPAQYLSTSPTRDNTTNALLTAAVTNPFANIAEFAGSGLNGPTTQRQQLLRPMPQFTGATASYPAGSSWYHSVRVRLDKRFSASYQMQFSYTLSKFMEAMSYLNDTDTAPTHEVSPQDRPHRVAGSGIWELPVGRGKKFFGAAPRWADAIAGGWQLNMAYSFQSGPPLEFGDVLYYGGNINLPSDQRSVDRWFNTSVFELAASQQLVNHIRQFPNRFGNVRAPSSSAINASVAKNFRIHERLRMQIRGEAYNALNQRDLAPPTMGPTNTAFGQITASTADSNARWAMVAFKLMF